MHTRESVYVNLIKKIYSSKWCVYTDNLCKNYYNWKFPLFPFFTSKKNLQWTQTVYVLIHRWAREKSSRNVILLSFVSEYIMPLGTREHTLKSISHTSGHMPILIPVSSFVHRLFSSESQYKANQARKQNDTHNRIDIMEIMVLCNAYFAEFSGKSFLMFSFSLYLPLHSESPTHVRS